MSLFETIEIDVDVIKNIAHQHWGITLGTLIKASQNHTFSATSTTTETSTPVIVRVTPDPRNEQRDRIELEVAFLQFLTTKHPHLNVCKIIPSITGKHIVIVGDLVVVAFEHAKGDPVVWAEYRWLRDTTLVDTWGKWFGKFHLASQEFSVTYPDIARRARHWTDLHCSIMQGTPVHPDDELSVSDPTSFGILHGDLNCSNFFYDYASQSLSVFDWDQIQRGWFLYDLSQAIFGVVMLRDTGSTDGTRVDFANVEEFTDRLVKGYESVEGIKKVDRAVLERMIGIKKRFYYVFCKRAVGELEGDTARAGMRVFCKFIVDWIESEKENK